MPRSGSTLLETMLSMNPRIKDLGESNSLTKAIAKTQNPNGIYLPQELYEAYSEIEPIDRAKYTYSTDKQLYNFIYIDFIVNCMPGAKIIHCRRNPMDNILSMYRRIFPLKIVSQQILRMPQKPYRPRENENAKK